MFFLDENFNPLPVSSRMSTPNLAWFFVHQELPAAALPGCPSLVLDRQWLLPDASLCRAYGMPILPLPQRAAMIVSTGIRDSTPVQTILKAGVVAAHVQAERLEMWQVGRGGLAF